MKLQTKTNQRGRANKKTKSALASVVLVFAKKPVIRHFKLVENRHTGKLIHHKHTSHVILAGFLVVTGFFLYLSNSITRAESIVGTVSIGLVVPGPPPTVGATILSPSDESRLVDSTVVDVSGTCAADTFVVISDNNLPIGSSICTGEGVFTVEVQLQLGTNILTALNYDSLNQVGPDTPSVTVYVTKSAINIPPTVPENPVSPLPPENPSIIPGVDGKFDTCDDYSVGKLKGGGELRVVVVCSPRIFGPGIEQVLGILVWGGTPPYAISINWGDDSHQDTLISIAEPGYHTVKFAYTFPGTYKVAFRLKDKAGESSTVQTAVQVSGEVNQPGTIDNEIIDSSWFNISVPLYMIAVAITLGFWGGDIFYRKFGTAGKHGKRPKVL